jgi:hypothetical protein
MYALTQFPKSFVPPLILKESGEGRLSNILLEIEVELWKRGFVIKG